MLSRVSAPMRCSLATRIFAACREWRTSYAASDGCRNSPAGHWLHPWRCSRGRVTATAKWLRSTADEESTVHPYFLARMLFGAEEREALAATSDYESDYAKSQQFLDRMLRDAVAATESLDPVNRVSYLESTFYMRNTLLRDSDFMSMAHGLELRVPFLDRALVEACFRIPGARKLAGNSPKGLLLASLGVELPEEIVNRPKRGFTLPFEKWLRGEMRPVVEDTLLHGNWDHTSISDNAVKEVWVRFLAGKTSWSRPWSLFVLQRWCQQHL